MRKQKVWGYIHDETNAFSGGIAGNAGLFSNANDLAKLCQMWLNGGVYGGERYLSEATTKQFTEERSEKSRRGLGFDRAPNKEGQGSPTCDEAQLKLTDTLASQVQCSG
jgi:CubicO group peptidase (beta-lactamase class C family)